MSAPAWMPLYVAEYLADTGHLTRDEHGAYMLLIMHYWQNGGLPDDPRKLAKITRSESVDDWSSIARTISLLFQSGWRHKRIDAELAKAKNSHERRRNAGKLGGKAKASNASSVASNATMLEKGRLSRTSSFLDSSLLKEPSKLASARDRPQAARLTVEFNDEFWPGYPHRVGKKAALKAWPTARKANSLDAIMAGLERYKQAKPPDRQWMNPATFLNQERFNDQPATVAPGQPSGGIVAAVNSLKARLRAKQGGNSGQAQGGSDDDLFRPGAEFASGVPDAAAPAFGVVDGGRSPSPTSGKADRGRRTPLDGGPVIDLEPAPKRK